ncbi:class I SAM-dependent methyltransferase [Caulobacter sp. NIBR2454]|uniref:class I SAM-dependent methyltransferase n=1 Tax=Caulobacter sp. NIBR2454 TaxID=3015996 RepID=UPI0022B725C1|nr:methyltransferase [Caulobacter sp. NIBR2454]
MRKPLLSLAAALLVTACATTAAPPAAPGGRPAPGAGDPFMRALNDPKRPEADVARDDDRKPAEVLAFGGVRPGAKVADLIPGNGYYTRILSRAVGPTGKVYTYVPDELTKLANRKPAVAGIADDPAYGNVEMVLNTLPNFGAPEKLDLVLSAGTYHYHYTRLLGSPNVVAINRKIYESLKPGGVFLVVEAMAPAGTAAQGAENLNRIDPATVRADVTKAGFVFEGESPVLRTTADTYRTNALAADAGRVDQFVYKFRKPRTAAR